MRATKFWAGALASALLLASNAPAQYPPPRLPPNYSPVMGVPLGYAPNTCGPGFYTAGPDGTIYGPNYYLRPCFEPFQGVRPQVRCINGQFVVGPQQQQQGPQYPSHPYARSPRDFFMFRESMEEQQGRQTRPTLVP